MLASISDSFFGVLPRMGAKLLASVSFLPVLHVERLYDDSSFQNVLSFARSYLELTGSRSVLTVITPAAPMLSAEIAAAGFSEAGYHERTAALAEYCDIGIHGHYLRQPEDAVWPIHNFWSERSVVENQLSAECDWLESRGLMRRRVYSGGWWYLDSNVLSALEARNFEFEFTVSRARYNDSPGARAVVGTVPTSVFQTGPRSRLSSVWAVSGLCGSRTRSAVPRRTLSAFPVAVISRTPSVFSLYSHDWDMDVESAMKTISDLGSHGATYVSLDELVALRINAVPSVGVV